MSVLSSPRVVAPCDDAIRKHAPRLRRLVYRYRAITDGDGRAVHLGPAVADPADLAGPIARLLAHEAVEVFGIVCLTTRRRPICWHEVSRGSLNVVYLDPREVFRPAMLVNAASIVLAHNHPSGDPEPSPDDRDLTRRLTDAGHVLGVAILDHLIVGDGAFVSLRSYID